MKDYTRIILGVAILALVVVVSDIDISFIGHGFGSMTRVLLISGLIWFFVARCGGGCCRMRSRAPEAAPEV